MICPGWVDAIHGLTQDGGQSSSTVLVGPGAHHVNSPAYHLSLKLVPATALA